MKGKRLTISREILVEEYVNKLKPMHQIAKEQGVSVGGIYNLLTRYGIEGRRHLTDECKRRMSEAKKGKPSPIKGIKRSEATKERVRLAKLGKYSAPSRFGGHRKKRTDGYIIVYCPNHPYSTKDGYVMEHVLVMESRIGRYITRDEVVHHKNHIRDDNRIENLQLMTFKEHAGFHMKERWAKKKGVMTYQ